MNNAPNDHDVGSENSSGDTQVPKVFRYSPEEMMDLFQFNAYPPEKLVQYCEIISPLGSQKPVHMTPYSDLEKRSYFKGVNSYLALLEKYPQFRTRGRGGRGRRGGRFNSRSGNWDNWDKRFSAGSIPNGVGPPGQWDQQNWSAGGGPRQRWGSGASNSSEPGHYSQNRRPDWVRGGVWTRGGGGGNGHRGGRGNGTHADKGVDAHGGRPGHQLDAPHRQDGGISPNGSGSQPNLTHEVEEIWEDDWDLELIGDTPGSECDFEDHDEEWSRILSHASLYDLREHADGADSPAAWSECPLRNSASPPRSLCLDAPILQRLVRQELLRSPSHPIKPELLQEMVENVLTQLPVVQQDGGVSPLTPSEALELTEAKRRLEEELRHRNSLLMEQENRLRRKEEELEIERRKHMRAWDQGPPHRQRQNRPKSLVEIQWEQAAEEGFPVACYRPVSWAEQVSRSRGSRCDNGNGRNSAFDPSMLADKPKPLTRHISLDVLHHREDNSDADSTGWIQRKGRRRRVFRRVDLHNFNTVLTSSPQ